MRRELEKNKLYVLKKPTVFDDGTEEWWGKFVYLSHDDIFDSSEKCFSPRFAGLWPGLWINEDELEEKIGEPNMLEWVEFYSKIAQCRIKSFLHHIKEAFKSLIGK